MRIQAFKVIIVIFGIILLCVSPTFTEGPVDKDLKAAADSALTWLKNQMVPNQILANPVVERRNLILSYELDRSDPAYKYIYARSIIYDNALAVIAFSMAGDFKSAALIINALKRAMRTDGGFWFGYNTQNEWPSEGDNSGAIERTGTTAWVGYSILYYLNRRMEAEPDYKDKKEAGLFLEMARKNGDYLAALQVHNSGDIRSGLITGGKNDNVLVLKDGSVEENFQEGTLDWVSTEHNIDCYFFLRELGRALKSKEYTALSDQIRDGLFRLWSQKDHQYYRGVKPEGFDMVLALDCASWGAIFSLAAGKPGSARESLNALDAKYLCQDILSDQAKKTIRGYKPYFDKDIFENNPQVASFYYKSPAPKTWKDFQGVWSEGSLGAALANLKLGKKAEALNILKEMQKLQNSRGGIQYFTKVVPYEFSAYPSTASTAWFVMAYYAYQNEKILKSFWGE